MRNVITGTVIAAALSLGSTAPAFADRKSDERVAKFIFGALALYALKEASDNKKKKKASASKVTNFSAIPEDRVHKKPTHKKVSRKILPAECFRHVRTHRGQIGLFGKKCLTNSYRYTAHLPAACRTRIAATDGRMRRGYGATCLRNQGYRMSSR